MHLKHVLQGCVERVHCKDVVKEVLFGYIKNTHGKDVLRGGIERDNERILYKVARLYHDTRDVEVAAGCRLGKTGC